MKREIKKEKENLDLETYVKIFEGMELLGYERVSEDMMLNDTSSESEAQKERKGCVWSLWMIKRSGENILEDDFIYSTIEINTQFNSSEIVGLFWFLLIKIFKKFKSKKC